MKILQVCPYNMSRLGGVQKHILDLSDRLEARGHDIRIIAPGHSKKPPRKNIWQVGRMKLINFSGSQFEISILNKADLQDTLQRIEDFAPDVTHFHTIWTPMMPFQLFMRCKSARIATFHDEPPDNLNGRMLRRVFRLLSRWFLNRLDAAITVSTAPLKHLNSGPAGVTPIILPPAVDLSSFRDHASIGKVSGKWTNVLFLGRFEPRKGIRTFLEAGKQLVEHSKQNTSGPNIRLLAAGYGRNIEDVEVARAEIGADRFEIVHSPRRMETTRVMQKADIFVAPSPWGESFGIVLIEAMSVGTPVVAANNDAYSTVMTGPAADNLFSAGDTTALVDRVWTLACDKTRQEELANWGKEHARRFDIENTVQNFEAVYEQAVTRKALRLEVQPSKC